MSESDQNPDIDEQLEIASEEDAEPVELSGESEHSPSETVDPPSLAKKTDSPSKAGDQSGSRAPNKAPRQTKSKTPTGRKTGGLNRGAKRPAKGAKVIKRAAKPVGGPSPGRGVTASGAKKIASGVKKTVADSKKAAVQVAKTPQRVKGAILGIGLVKILAAGIVGGAALFGAITMTVSVDQVIGQNEAGLCANGDKGFSAGAANSDPNAVVSGLTSYPPTSYENRLRNAIQIADWLARTPFKYMGNRPMSREQIAAVMGNFYQESGWNPFVIQGIGENFGENVVTAYPNSRVRAMCPGGGRAIGILQMDGERCVILVDLAEKMGKHWSDLNVQMEFLRREFNDIEGMGSHISPWFTPGKPNYKEFPEPGRTVEFYTTAFNCSYERSGDCTLPYRTSSGGMRYIGNRDMAYRQRIEGQRIKYAKDFLAQWQAGAGASGMVGNGGACAVLGNMAGDFNQRIVDMAKILAYPTTAQSYGPPKPQYKYVKDTVDPQEPGFYRSCDRFVMSVIRSTVDKNIPRGNTMSQKEYLVAHPELWKPITNVNDLLPGDVVVMPTLTRTGHIVIYLGEPTENTVAHASIGTRVGGIGNEGRFRRNFGPNFAQWTGFRYIGPDNNYIQVNVSP